MLIDDIESDGFALIPGLLTRQYANDLRAEIASALRRAPDVAKDAENLRNPTRTASSVLELDWRQLIQEAMSEDVLKAHLQLLGPEASVVPPHCRVRRQFAPINRPAEHVVHHWHSDAGVGYEPGKVLTLWITLDDCGEAAPSLEFLARSGPPQMPGEHDDAHFSAVYGGGDRKVIYAAAGDAVLFPATTFHRTHSNAKMTSDRISIDVRCVGAVVPAILADCPRHKLTDLLLRR